MKKICSMGFCLMMVFVLVACGGNGSQPKEYSKKVWTPDELKEVNGQENFMPNNPQENMCLVIATNRADDNQNAVDTTGNNLLSLVDGLHNIQAISDPQEDDYKEYRKLLKAEDKENIPEQIAQDPNQGSIGLDYEIHYSNAGKFANNGKMVTIYACKLKIKAVKLSDNTELATVELTRGPGSADVLPDDVGDAYYMDPPSLTSEYAAELLLPFFQKIAGN